MAREPPSALAYVLVVAGPPVGVGFLVVDLVVSCGPVGYPPGETPRGFHRFIVTWQRIGIAYGNGCEATSHPLVLVGGLALVGAGVVSLVTIWRHVEREAGAA